MDMGKPDMANETSVRVSLSLRERKKKRDALVMADLHRHLCHPREQSTAPMLRKGGDVDQLRCEFGPIAEAYRPEQNAQRSYGFARFCDGNVGTTANSFELATVLRLQPIEAEIVPSKHLVEKRYERRHLQWSDPCKAVAGSFDFQVSL